MSSIDNILYSPIWKAVTLMITEKEMERQKELSEADLRSEQHPYKKMIDLAALREEIEQKSTVQREQIQSRLLHPIPAGAARDKMKTLLEAAPIDKIEATFERFAPLVLEIEAQRVQPRWQPERPYTSLPRVLR